MFRSKTLVVLVIIIAAITPSFSNESKEVKIGRENAEQFEKEAKLVEDPDIVERVNRIGVKLAQVAKAHEVPAEYGSSDLSDFDYRFKVIDNQDINAFSLPGGFIYVYRGLIDFVKSDDELAGVLGHEIAHASHHHMMFLMRKQSKMDSVVALIALTAALSKMNGRDLTNILYGAQFVRTARLTGYGQTAEFDADSTGVIYAHKAGYDPRGILQFLEQLTDYQQKRGEVRNLGIFQTHPPSVERSTRVAQQLADLGVQVDKRQAADLAAAEISLTTVNGRNLSTVSLAGRKVCTVADDNGVSSYQRAQKTRAAINELLREGLSPFELRDNPSTMQLSGRKRVILQITSADSAAIGLPPTTLLARAAEAVRYALWSDWVKTSAMTSDEQ
ncbi:MAG: M48 family metalloprotease [Armatimonadetes bacterium]|nr:M48 family metalloprotease [Armatimonadota bacterium]